MALPLVEQLQESLGDLANFSMEKFQKLLQEMMKTFQYIQSKIDSKERKEQEEALQLALELKEALENHTQALAQSVGMDVQQLIELAEKRELFTEEERHILDGTKAELESFQAEFKKLQPQKELKAPKRKKTNLINI